MENAIGVVIKSSRNRRQREINRFAGGNRTALINAFSDFVYVSPRNFDGKLEIDDCTILPQSNRLLILHLSYLFIKTERK